MDVEAIAPWTRWASNELHHAVLRKGLIALLHIVCFGGVVTVESGRFGLSTRSRLWLVTWALLFYGTFVITLLASVMRARAACILVKAAAVLLVDYPEGFCSDCEVARLRRDWLIREEKDERVGCAVIREAMGWKGASTGIDI